MDEGDEQVQNAFGSSEDRQLIEKYLKESIDPTEDHRWADYADASKAVAEVEN